jgi:hypothetical protein
MINDEFLNHIIGFLYHIIFVILFLIICPFSRLNNIYLGTYFWCIREDPQHAALRCELRLSEKPGLVEPTTLPRTSWALGKGQPVLLERGSHKILEKGHMSSWETKQPEPLEKGNNDQP